MIGYLDGTVRAKQEDWLIVDVAGVGYRVWVTPAFAAEAGRVGDPVTLYVHTYVRENEISLYGFRTPEQLELFEVLLDVNRVGPKVAMAALATFDPATIINAVNNDQADVLTQISGVGKRTAQRMILDLKDKVKTLAVELPGVNGADDSDAISALTALGYSVQEAQSALREVPGDLPLEDKIFRALQQLSE